MRFSFMNHDLMSHAPVGIPFAIALLSGCLSAQGARAVQVYPAKAQSMEVRSSLQGEILPLSRMELIPRVTGYVKSIHVSEGARIAKGKLLVSMDCPDLEQDRAVANAGVTRAESVLSVAGSMVDAAERAVEVAQADHQQSKTELEVAKSSAAQAKSSYQRIQKLHTEGAATQDEFEAAELLFLKTNSSIETAKSAIVAASARVRAAETQVGLRRAEVTKAKAGVTVAQAVAARSALFVELASMSNPYALARITRQIVDVGNLAIANQTALLELMDVSRVRVRFTVPRAEASRVGVGTAVRLVLPRSVPTIEAKVTRVSGALEPSSRTMACEVELDNSAGQWIPGALLKVDVLVESLQAALLIPGRGIVRAGDAAYVWVADAGKVRKIEVKTGIHRGPLVQILDGLKPGQQVVVAGFTGLANGDQVVSTVVGR